MRALLSLLVVSFALAACGGDGGSASPDAGGPAPDGVTAPDEGGAPDGTPTPDAPGPGDTASGPDGGTGDTAPVGFYSPENWDRVVPDDGATWTYRSGQTDLPARFVAGDTTLGAPRDLFEALNPATPTGALGVRLWADLSNPWLAEVYEAHVFQNAPSADVPSFRESWDPPIAFELDLEPGVVQSVDYTTHIVVGNDQPVTDDYHVDYQLVSNDATVTVPYGEVTGCFQFHAVTTPVGGGFTIEIDLWIHPDLGLVKVNEIIGIFDVELVSVGG